MAKDISKLYSDILEIGRSIDKNTNDLSVRIGYKILSMTGVMTRVDTSRAVSNWQVSINKRISGKSRLEPYFFGKAGSTAFPSLHAMLAAGKIELLKKKGSGEIWISNVTPYIRFITEIDKQAEVNSMIVKQELKKAKLLVKNGR